MVEQNKDDYYDVNFDKKTESPESMTFFFQIISLNVASSQNILLQPV